MKENNRHIGDLFRKYREGLASAEEKLRLFAYFRNPAGQAALERELDEVLAELPPVGWEQQSDVQHALARVRENLDAKLSVGPVYSPQSRKGRLRWLPYAAAAVLVAALVGYFAVGNRQSMVIGPGIADIQPGGNRATLTLADGRMIDLSEAQTGIVVGDGITYLDGSAVLGEQGQDSPHGRLTTYNLQLTTPNGGTYQITLPDGTRVWLNAASTLKYPSRFDGNERVVHLEGEAYFDVNEQTHSLTNSQTHKLTGSQAHRLTGSQKIPKLARELRAASLVPFKVITNGQTVEVLGTEFNISAYADDPETTTTLIEGKVKVSASNSHAGLTTHDLRPTTNDDLRPTTKTLAPGEQARLAHNMLQKQVVDVNEVIAWKNGRFSFGGKTFGEIMDELGRWYDVEVVYEGPVPTNTFVGGAYRTDRMSLVLELLRAGDISYRVTQGEDGSHRLIIGNKKVDK